MNFKKLNFLIVALIILVIGAIFLLRLYSNKLIKKDTKGTVKKEEKVLNKVTLDETVNKILGKLKNDGIIEIYEGDTKKIVFKRKGIDEVLSKALEGIEDNISFEVSKKEVAFFKDNQRVVYPYVLLIEDLRPKLVIVIDDIGNSLELGERVLKLQNVTLSIIPQLKYSLYFANRGREMKRDILVHMPMEPHSFDKYKDGETKFLTTEMDAEEIKKLSKIYLDSVPNAIGVNNHMGSKFTEDAERLEIFLENIQGRKMFFLDSKTSINSVAGNVAEKLKMPFFVRDVFLDHELNEETISKQLDKALEIANQKGYAIVIGHPHKETLNVLEKRYEEIRKKVNVVPISALLKMKRG
ncbi:MAG: divergent polysaccharide deacetylase family protein [Proteobacteria bacterium]|nr:divergent polysaccharide deacetylase family protein [Pseudomonadota bacterium]